MVDRTKENVNGAVATHLGWVNPKTGELLVSIRGLPDAVQWSKRTHSLEDLQQLLLDAVDLTDVPCGSVDAPDAENAQLELDARAAHVAYHAEKNLEALDLPKVDEDLAEASASLDAVQESLKESEERKVFTVDVGDMSKEEAAEVIEKIAEDFKKAEVPKVEETKPKAAKKATKKTNKKAAE